MSSAIPSSKPPLNRFLKMAVMAGVESAVQIHIDRGDDLNARDGNGLTLLMLSAARNNTAMCKLLLSAGVDKDLLDPSGNTAHAIAVAVGAHEAVVILEAVASAAREFDRQELITIQPSDEGVAPSTSPTVEFLTRLDTAEVIDANIAATASVYDAKESSEPGSTPEFDLFGWEAEEDASPPAVDPSVAKAASALQASISKHDPIDSSEDWDDIDIYLPERSLPLARTGDAESRELLRLLLLRSVREGSVPSAAVEALSLDDDQSPNPETEALLTMVVNDLGAEVDERFEYITPDENFEVFVNPEENPIEEEIVADALAFVDNLASRFSEPLRSYQKEFQRVRLISAEEEVELGKAMEVELERALDTLAAWPRGIELTLAAGSMIKSKQRPLTWLSRGPTEAQPDIESEPDSEADMASVDQADEEAESDEDSQFDTSLPLGNFVSEFSDAVDRLASLPIDTAQRGAHWQAVRDTLSSLRLNRRFLLELADTESAENPDFAATEYSNAIQAYKAARERMTTANLKLVFHLAKKYLYSGEPLDDLAQEGNIGLLKAVERYDWRRGFKFSTYATWWIRQQIGRHVADKCRTIRIPVHVYEKTQRLTRETLALESEIGREPELDEIAVRMGIPVHKVSALLCLNPELLPIDDLSIDEMIAVDARYNFVSPDPFEIAFNSDVRKTIVKVLATLDPREEQIIRLRYGIGICDSLTLDDIGQRYGVTRERIRQIEAKAIRKLMQPSRIKVLSNTFFGHPFSKEDNGLDDFSQPREGEHSSETEQILLDSPTITPFPTKVPSIERLMVQATDFGISITDERIGPTGKIWINFIDMSDSRYRKLARKLIAVGFEFMPGKGYWK